MLVCLGALAAHAAEAPPATYRGRSAAQWIEQLAAPDIPARWYAAYALGQLGSAAAGAVEPLMGILQDQREYEYVRGATAWALGRIGLPGAEPAVPLLIETLSSRHLSVRRNAPRALGRLGPAARQAVPRLRALLADEDAAVRIEAAGALWLIDRAPEALSALRDMVGRGDAQACDTVRVLGQMPPAPETTALLVAALGARDEEVRATAAWALAQQGPEVIAALAVPLSAPEPATRQAAVETLGYLGPAAVGPLGHALRDQAAEVRAAAARELGRLGPAAKDAEPALVEALGDSDVQVQRMAAWALGRVRAKRD